MSTFDKHIAKTLQWEGGYVNDPKDRGSETYRGVSRKFHPEWEGWNTVDAKPRKRNEIIPSLEQSVRDFYKKHYWDKIKLDDVCNENVAGFLFDFYVNSGSNAIKTVQKLVGATADGIIGPDTIFKINNYDNGLSEKLKMERIAFVKGIVKRNPSQSVFLTGWMARINSFT